MFWLIFAAGAVIATVHPESREKVKDVPWMSLAVAIGLAALGDGIQDGLRNVGANSVKGLKLQSDTSKSRGHERLHSYKVFG